MGDLVEVTTRPRHGFTFYRNTSGLLSFEVKTSGGALVGLAKKIGSTCDFWVGIGENSDRCWIKQTNGHGKRTSVPNVVSSNEYRRFWICCTHKNIMLGQNTNPQAIVKISSNGLGLNYFTFSMITGWGGNVVDWRFILPPLRDLSLKNKVLPEEGLPHWVPADTQIPDGALIGGYDNEPLYIIRAHHMGSLTPGKYVSSEGLGYISWNGQDHEKSEFEVLCGYNCTWVKADINSIPIRSFVGGYSEDRHETMYVGRAMHNGKLIPGKVQPSHKCCYFPYEGRELCARNFEVLVVADAYTRAACKHFVANMHYVEGLNGNDFNQDGDEDDLSEENFSDEMENE